MEPVTRAMRPNLGERAHVVEQSAKVGEFSQKAERWPGFLPIDRLDEIGSFVRPIIPLSGIVGSNPAPATNLRP